MSGDGVRTGVDVSVDPRRWYAVVLLCLAFFMVVLGSTIVFTAAPTMTDDLNFAAGNAQWIFSASALTSGGLLFFGGRLADVLGRRRVFMTGVALFALASAGCALASSDVMLIGARTVQGAATALVTPAALALVATIFPVGPERNRALGIWSMIGGLGATAGLLVGGTITEALGWRWIFVINLPTAAIVLALSPTLLSCRRGDRARGLDPAGAGAITAAMVLLVYGITQVPQAGWISPQTIGLLAVSVGLIALFAVVEARSPAPLLPLRILRSRTLVAGNVIMLVAGLAVDGMLFVLTLYAQQVLGYSAVQFGLALTVMTIASIGGSYLAQHVVTRIGPRPVAATGLALIAGSCLLLTRISVGGTFVGDLLPGLLLFGLGMGVTFVAGSVASLTDVPERDSGVASGLQNTSFTLGTALGVAVLSTIATARTERLLASHHVTPAALTGGYQAAFGAAAVVAGMGLVIVLITTGGRPSRPVHTSRGQEDVMSEFDNRSGA